MSIVLSYKKFKKASGLDLQLFFESFIAFVNGVGFQSIFNYYTGGSVLPQKSFTILDDLIERGFLLQSSFKTHKNIFDNTADWDLLEGLENSIIRLLTIKNLKKYLRSSMINAFSSSGLQGETYLLKQGQNFEDVSSTLLKSAESDNDWVDIAVSNDIIEEDYTQQGGNEISLSYSNKGTVNSISVVIDELAGEKINGLDFQRKLEFSNDDLKVLTYKETILQAVEILVNLKKRDNPEFQNDGLTSLTGSTMAAVGYPLLFRQLVNVFSTDDTISVFTINNIRVEEDGLFLDLSIETALGSIINESIPV